MTLKVYTVHQGTLARGAVREAYPKGRSIASLFLTWGKALCAWRPTSRHRAIPVRPAAADVVPPQPAPALRKPRLEDTLIDADALPIVRPYLEAFEARQRQQCHQALGVVPVGAALARG